jgi:hypothetical protein
MHILPTTDKYFKSFMEMTCSAAPNDDGGMKWCIPYVKDMEDDYDEDDDALWADDEKVSYGGWGVKVQRNTILCILQTRLTASCAVRVACV